jgi:hypothetical protein
MRGSLAAKLVLLLEVLVDLGRGEGMRMFFSGLAVPLPLADACDRAGAPNPDD